MLSNLLKINFPKEKPVSPNLKNVDFVDIKTHSNKFFDNNGLNDLNIKTHIHKINKDDGKVTGSSFDNYNKPYNFKVGKGSNPFDFMGLNINFYDKKIAAPNLWNEKSDKEVIIANMQREAGFDNAYTNKIVNYATDGAIDLQGNGDESRMKGLESVIDSMHRELENKTGEEFKKVKPLYKEQNENAKLGKPLKVTSVEAQPLETVTTEPKKLTKVNKLKSMITKYNKSNVKSKPITMSTDADKERNTNEKQNEINDAYERLMKKLDEQREKESQARIARTQAKVDGLYKSLNLTTPQRTPTQTPTEKEAVKEPIKETAPVQERVADIEAKIDENALKEQVQEIYKKYSISSYLSSNFRKSVTELDKLTIPQMERLIAVVGSERQTQIPLRKKSLTEVSTPAKYADSMRNIGVKTPTPKKIFKSNNQLGTNSTNRQ